jgi:hypothetical protein
METKDFFTLILAVYGAAVSSYLGFKEIQRNRKSVRIILEYVTHFEHAQIIIVNSGVRPVTITQLFLEIEKTGEHNYKFWFRVHEGSLYKNEEYNHSFPFTLTDGQHKILILSENASAEVVYGKTRIIVYDAEGNTYEKYKRRLYNPHQNRFEDTYEYDNQEFLRYTISRWKYRLHKFRDRNIK